MEHQPGFRGHRLRLLVDRAEAVLADRAQPAAGCSKRIDNDVAADADPATGVAVYDTYNGNGGWNEVGGTSASSPMIAAVYALAGNAGQHPGRRPLHPHRQPLRRDLAATTAPCSPAYLCTAGTGYDGPTGLGTPNGIAAFTSGGTTGNTVTVTNPGNQTTHRRHRGQPADPAPPTRPPARR